MSTTRSNLHAPGGFVGKNRLYQDYVLVARPTPVRRKPGSTHMHVVRQPLADDWQAYRAVRLAML